MEQAVAIVPKLQQRRLLEIVFKGDEGTGQGPTLEFYNLLGEEICADKDLWQVSEHMLFPKALPQN